MNERGKINSYKVWAVVIGSGLALSPIHNQWLTELVTKDGEVGFFLPAFGTAIWLMGSLVFVVWNWEHLNWGDKRIYIPLFVIVGAIGLSGITADRWQDNVSPLLMGLSLFALYLVARKLGKDMFLPLAVGAGIASLGVIVYVVILPGLVTGGFVFEGNYDIVAGYVLLGVALFVHRWQWLLAGLALGAMFLSGSPEAVFSVGVVAIAVLWRRDWSKKLLIAISPALLLAAVWFGLGHGQELYNYALQVGQGAHTMARTVTPPQDDEECESGGDIKLGAIDYRLYVIKEAMSDIKPLGEGYYVTAFIEETVHNVPLVIVQQLGYPGMLAGLAWLWVTFYCLVRTRWKYAWVLVLSLSVFDHFIWTQLGAWWWAIIGVSTASGINSDLLFRKAL